MAKQPKWFKELTEEQRKAFWEKRQEALEEGVSTGEDIGQDRQKTHDTAAIILVLRNRLHYTNAQINEFITAMNEEMGNKTVQDAREIVTAYFETARQELQDKV